MPQPASPPPAWSLGPLADLTSHINYEPITEEAVAKVIADLALALPSWFAEPHRYAWHILRYIDYIVVVSMIVHDGKPLHDDAVDLLRRLSASETLSGRVSDAIEIMAMHIALADHVKHDQLLFGETAHGVSALLQQRLSTCDAILLKEILDHSGDWFEWAVNAQLWDSAGDIAALRGEAVMCAAGTVEVEDRLKVLATLSDVIPAAAYALVKAERFAHAMFLIENGRQLFVRAHRERMDLRAVLSSRDSELMERLRLAELARRQSIYGVLNAGDEKSIAEANTHARFAQDEYDAVWRAINTSGLKFLRGETSVEEVYTLARHRALVYLWTSDYGAATILIQPDGRVRWESREQITSRLVRDVMRPWTEALRESEGNAIRLNEALISTTNALQPTVGRLLSSALTRAAREPPTYAGWRLGDMSLIVSGPLAALPLHTWGPTIRAGDGSIVAVPIAYAPNAGQLKRARRVPLTRSASRRLLSVADPSPIPASLAPLDYARIESQMIGSTADEYLPLWGPCATRGAFLKRVAEFPVIHLACHGVVSDDQPDLSLQFAGAPLRVGEIADRVSLDAQLVVLSACNSGRGDPRTPDEVLDAGSLFLAAGARAVVTNMWPVDDLAAALFVRELFRRWDWGDGEALARAVSGAQRWLAGVTVGELNTLAGTEPLLAGAINRYVRFCPSELRRFSPPIVWASFAYSGA